MGLEAVCRVRLNNQVSEGKAHCGDGELDFRGEFRFRWMWKDLSEVSSAEGVLTAVKGSEKAELHVGEAADKWAQAILNPKSRLDKLGLKAGHQYAAWGQFDSEFESELTERSGRPAEHGLDMVFVRLNTLTNLSELLRARGEIVANGAVWAVWEKGRKELTETHVRDFARANGLVDVKVASFSSDLSALKLVIPVAMRQ